MKKVMALLMTALMVVSLCACSSTKQNSNAVTIKQFIENKEFPEGKTMTVTVKSFENPVLAVVEDESGETVNLFGVFVDGEMKSFDEEGIEVGTSITIQNGKYNEYEGTIEIAEAELVSVNK